MIEGCTMDENDEKIRIERILGVSVSGSAHFDSDLGLLAYPAGNSVVLLDVGSGTVVSHVVLETKRGISALQLKGNSLLFVASHESNFLRIVNWESGLVKDLAPCQNVICCAVSSNLGVVVTVSSDRVVSVWDYKNLMSPVSNGSTPTQRSNTPGSSNRGRKLASSSVASKVSSVTFSPDGLYFVTSGSRHLKFWYIQLGKNECVLTGRPAILGSEHNQADFRDVVTDGNGTYAIANFEARTSSTLCQFDDRRFLDKWVQLKTKEANCVCMDEDLLFIGCADGIIRCFRAGKLDFVTTLPLPHHLGVHIAGATDVTSLSSHPPLSRFPHVVAITATGGKKVAAAYADSSLYVWDFQDIRRVGLTHSYLNHSGCIWDIVVGSVGNSPHSWPSFVTCSNDDTIRIWDTTSQNKTNLYSNECVDIKYISTRYLDSPLCISHGNGVRSVGIGTDFLCCGDRQGNLRLWGKKTKNEVIKVKTHKEEILSMDVRGSLLATASRDGCVHVYHISDEVVRVASLQEHSSSVTGIKFFFSERSPLLHLTSCGADKLIVIRHVLPKVEFPSEGNFMSALADGEFDDDGFRVEVRNSITSKTPLFDLEVDQSGKHVLVACQDGCVRVYHVSTGKQSRSLRTTSALVSSGSESSSTISLPTIIKLCLDPSGAYLVVSGTDKVITVFDYLKGEIIATLLGHSELSTALKFTPDLQNLLSVGGDSCIFVWALSREMIVTMKARLAEKRSRLASESTSPPPPPVPPLQKLQLTNSSPSPILSSTSSSPQRPPDYRFSFGQLPEWAKKQMTGTATSNNSGSAIKKAPNLPQGKWSERVEQATATGPITIKSFHDADTVVPLAFPSKPGNPGASSQHIPNSAIEEPFEPCEDSLKEILKRSDDLESSDFHSDLKSPTDGEEGTATGRSRQASETDDSGTKGSSKLYKSISHHNFEINRSRNAELIMSVKLKRNELSKSRLELEKRLDDTRRKLQSIGYKSMSQSTTDLTRTLYRALPHTVAALTQLFDAKMEALRLEFLAICSSSMKVPDLGRIGRVLPITRWTPQRGLDEDTLDAWEGNRVDDTLRRACSLQDLNKSGMLTGAPLLPPHPRRKKSTKKPRSRNRSTGTGGFDSQKLITRSTSMSALMVDRDSVGGRSEADDDSESESLPPQPSYMSKTISSHGKSRRKGSLGSDSSQDIRRIRVLSSSEQNLTKAMLSPNRTSKGTLSPGNISKAQPIHSVPKGLAVVTGVRQGGKHANRGGDEEIQPLNLETASSAADTLRRSLDQVLVLRHRLSNENVRDREPIGRILDDGLLSAQRLLHQSVLFQTEEQQIPPKILTEHEPIDL